MRAGRAVWIAALALGFAAPGRPALSQITLDAPGIVLKKPKPGPPDVRARPLAWPRLDPGSVLCRTPDDLERLAANRRGGAGGGPADCRVIAQPTGIDIIQRQGPGMTQVRVTGANGQNTNETGWTDAWLPARAPGGATAASSR